jgi:hypothetical protein
MDAPLARYHLCKSLLYSMSKAESQLVEAIDKGVRERALAGFGDFAIDCSWYSQETLDKVKLVFQCRFFNVSIKTEAGSNASLRVEWYP